MSRLVRALLRLYPSSFRDARGAEIEAHVAEERARLDGAGAAALAGFWLRTAWDLLAGALRLRLRPPGGRRAPTLLQDLRHAARGLRHTPVVTVVLVVTLGLGVGLNTAIFSVVDAVLLRPLEYRDPDRLVHVTAEVVGDEDTRASFSGGDYADVRAGVPALEDAAAVASIRQNLTGAGLPRQVMVGWGSSNLFGLLGVDAALGRVFDPGDPPGTVVLTHRLWRDQFGADPSVLGRGVRLDGYPHTVVGVLPEGFRLELPRFASDEVALWKNPDDFWTNGDVWTAQGPEFGLLRIIGRLAPGADVDRVRDQLSTVQADLQERFPGYREAGLRLGATPLHEDVVEDVRPTLALLGASVLAVLLIACANVTGILLVRAADRVRELALRRALGASRRRVVGLLLAESGLLALAGGGLGVAVAFGATRVLAALGPDLPRADTVAVDGRVLLFALGASILCTFAAGLVPAFGASKVGAGATLRAGGRVAGGSGARLRNALVVGQIAVSLVLLVGAGLLTASLARMRSVEPGFDPEGVLTFSVSLPGSRYGFPEESGRTLAELERRVRALPGVESGGVMWPIPLSRSRWSSPFRAGEVREGDQAYAGFRVGSAGYFEAMEIPVLEGRPFEDGDPREVVVIGRRVAERAWPGETAVGRTLVANPWGGQDVEFEVIGVVEDTRDAAVTEEPMGNLYFDMRHWSWVDWEFDVVVRTGGPPAALVPAVREILADIDPEVPLAQPATMAELMDADVAPTRFALGLVGLFSVTAGLLALVGLYGVISWAVGRRTKEIGIRMALGSARSAIVGLVLGQGLWLVAGGVGLGLAGAVAASRLLESWLYQVEPTDPATYLGVALALAVLALGTAWIPAHRATRLDPVEVLRSE